MERAIDVNTMSTLDIASMIKQEGWVSLYPSDNSPSWLVEKVQLYLVLTDQWMKTETTTPEVFPESFQQHS